MKEVIGRDRSRGEVERPPYKLKPLAPVVPLNQPGRLRFRNMLALYGVSHQTLRNRIKAGVIPKPDGYDGPLPYWLNSTIYPFFAPVLTAPAGETSSEDKSALNTK